MTNEEAIEELKYISDRMIEYQEGHDAIDMAIEALQDKWIPCSERLPAQTGEYLVTVSWEENPTWTDKFGYTPTNDGGWYDPEEPNQININWNDYVVAWMPLPEPYKGGEQNDDVQGL